MNQKKKKTIVVRIHTDRQEGYQEYKIERNRQRFHQHSMNVRAKQ